MIAIIVIPISCCLSYSRHCHYCSSCCYSYTSHVVNVIIVLVVVFFVSCAYDS